MLAAGTVHAARQALRLRRDRRGAPHPGAPTEATAADAAKRGRLVDTCSCRDALAASHHAVASPAHGSRRVAKPTASLGPKEREGKPAAPDAGQDAIEGVKTTSDDKPIAPITISKCGAPRDFQLASPHHPTSHLSASAATSRAEAPHGITGAQVFGNVSQELFWHSSMISLSNAHANLT